MSINRTHMTPDVDKDVELPRDTKTLLKDLRKTYPPRCIYPGQDPIEAHRYAAQVELVEELIAWWEEQEGPLD